MTIETTGAVVRLSSFTGATDDDKLAAAMSFCAAQTYHGITIQLDEPRLYTFYNKQTLYDGFSILGSHRPQDQARGSLPIGQKVKIRTSGGWFKLPGGDTFGCSWQGLSIDGSAGNRLLDGSATSADILWTSVFRDISSQNASNVLGSVAQKLLVTACTIDGWWNVNNVQERAFNIGGSDFYWKPSMMLLDHIPSLMPNNGYSMSFSSMSNIHVSNIYCTSEQESALLIAGGASDESMWINNCIWEGRNNTEYSNGALIRMSGGQAVIRDNRFAWAMVNPGLNGNGDLGVIHVTGGKLLIDGCTYRKQSTVAETVPFIYATGSSTKVVVRNIIAQGAWTGKPRVKAVNGAVIDYDSSVALV